MRPLLDAYFSPLSGVQLLAQPGSFYVSSAFSLAVSVIGKELVNRGWDSLAPGEPPGSSARPSAVLGPCERSPRGTQDTLCSRVQVLPHRRAVESSSTKQSPARRSLPVNNTAGSILTQVTTVKTQSSCTT